MKTKKPPRLVLKPPSTRCPFCIVNHSKKTCTHDLQRTPILPLSYIIRQVPLVYYKNEQPIISN